jgi:hypothetical protein
MSLEASIHDRVILLYSLTNSLLNKMQIEDVISSNNLNLQTTTATGFFFVANEVRVPPCSSSSQHD